MKKENDFCYQILKSGGSFFILRLGGKWYESAVCSFAYQ